MASRTCTARTCASARGRSSTSRTPIIAPLSKKRRQGGSVCKGNPNRTLRYQEGFALEFVHEQVAETLEGYATLKKLADSPDHIVPGHDPLVLQHYPAAKTGLDNWVVDLTVTR